jgi:hypothetical protein
LHACYKYVRGIHGDDFKLIEEDENGSTILSIRKL